LQQPPTSKGEYIRINLKFQVNSDDISQVTWDELPFRGRGLLHKKHLKLEPIASAHLGVGGAGKRNELSPKIEPIASPLKGKEAHLQIITLFISRSLLTFLKVKLTYFTLYLIS
jgi:hypothetical protein